jgi:hypothetical protein
MIEPLESRTLMSATVAQPPAPVVQPPSYALLGGNLNAVSDRVQDLPFVDLVKTTRGFYNDAGRLASNGKIDFADTDANGWPTEDFSFTAADNSEWGTSVQPGIYHMSFVGPAGTIVSILRNSVDPEAAIPATAPLPTLTKVGYSATTQVSTYDVAVPQGALLLGFDFSHTQGQVHDIKVLQPGYSLSSYPTFGASYLNLLKTMSPGVIRLMDFTHTNGNLVVNWADRAHVTDATQARASAPGELQSLKGVAWEYGIQLANTLHANIWVNIPAHANDNYIRQLALLLHNTLNSNLSIYVEYSNEAWNSGNEQYSYNLGMATSEVMNAARNHWSSNLNYDNLAVDLTQSDGGANAQTWADRLYARRSKNISDLFKGTWSDLHLSSPINTRVRVILDGQFANLSRFDNELKFINTVYGAPNKFFYGIGIAPYLSLGKDASKNGLTTNQVVSDLGADAASYKTNGAFSAAFSRANAYGLKLEAYEGGIDTYGANSVAAKAAGSLDPRMTDILTGFMDTWYSKGGDLFNWYTLGARSFSSPYGSYSITDDINNYNEPKELAYIAERRKHV